MVTLYGVNSRGQVFKSFVNPDEVDFYIKEKGLMTTEPEPKAEEKPIEKPVEVKKPGRPKKEDKDE